jgi:hypothetical protein
MKSFDLSIGDILELDMALGRNIRWAIEDRSVKLRLDEVGRKNRILHANMAWSSKPIEIKSMKVTGYSKVKQHSGKTKKVPEFHTTHVPGVEYSYSSLEIVFPYSFKQTNCTASPAVYLGFEIDPFEAFGVKKHHRMFIDGKVCLFSGHSMRFLRKVVTEVTPCDHSQ